MQHPLGILHSDMFLGINFYLLLEREREGERERERFSYCKDFLGKLSNLAIGKQ